MEAKSITKEIACKKHPGEKIQRISAIEGSNILYCIDCVIAIEDKQAREAVLPIKEFIQRAVSYYEKIQQDNTIRGDPPADLLAALDGEDEIISKISTHIEAEKAKVEISFEEIIQTFNTLCSKAKQEILTNLDNQLLNVRFNYRYFKEKINKYYGKQTEAEISALTTERGIVSAINQCESSTDLEFLIKQINDQIYENKLFDNFESRAEQMSKVLKELKNAIKSQGELLPKTPFSDQKLSQKMKATLQQAINTYIEESRSFTNQIRQLSFYNSSEEDSKITTNLSEWKMIKDWISPNSSIKLKLLIRGTRDGFDSVKFHLKCDNKRNTLVLVKTEFGKICGGFTELEWNATSNHKKQENAFLFSADLKTKFTLKQPQYSIYSDQHSLPAFGGGSDLYLCGSCDTKSGSYSNLGHSYDPGKFASNGNLKSLLTGGDTFKIEEYEVFEVEGYKPK